MPQEQFIRMVRNHGAEKILFASDSPWGGQKEWVEYFEKLSLSDDEKRSIGSENARTLLF